jgi:hypothetical protein
MKACIGNCFWCYLLEAIRICLASLSLMSSIVLKGYCRFWSCEDNLVAL